MTMGFGSRWLSWMEALVFTSSMSILVNGSPSPDFHVSRGLRQGDPLSPFLFTIVAEGFASTTRKGVLSRLYNSFKVPDEVEYNLLHFADDIILLGDGSWKNLWSIKSLMASGLSVILTKSKLYGVGNPNVCLAASAGFLGCKAYCLPFKFLGCMVGGNHRCSGFWKPLVNVLEARLSSWKGRMLSIGGRVTLINSVLANIPRYYFAFYKAPPLVIKKLEVIQRNFLWCGLVERKGIAWVSWLDICKDRDKGWMGVKHLGHFNRAMLAKWILRFLNEKEAIWWGILSVRYGDIRGRLWGSQS